MFLKALRFDFATEGLILKMTGDISNLEPGVSLCIQKSILSHR